MERTVRDTQQGEQQLVSPKTALAQLRQSITRGGPGAVPVMLGLVLIAVVFQAANHHFLTPLNLTNLFSQVSAIGVMSVGVVLVLLIGEIDLSIGEVSGLAAAIMAVLSVNAGVPGWVAILAALLTGVAIGFFQGSWIARLHVPSFVVTLAGYLAWQGALLYVLGSTGTINLTDPLIVGLANLRLPVPLGWVLAIASAAIYALTQVRTYRKRQRAGIATPPVLLLIGRVALVSAGLLIAVAIMSINRNPTNGGVPIEGVPLAVLLFLATVVIFDLITRRTRFGRYIFAVGGNVEAARRAGINVERVRIAVFTLSTTLAAFGGILAGSRLLAVNQSSGSGDILLNAIAAAVIGGTSLFGGRGSTWSALLGVLVIGAISNGMDLLAFSSSVKFMVTGAVLLLAVTLDAYGRTRRQQAGLG